MNEQPPRPEHSEFSEEERLLIAEMAKTTAGEFEGSEAQKALMEWNRQDEERSNVTNTSLANIQHNIKLGKIYDAAGYHEAAWETLTSVLDVVRFDPDPDGQKLYDQIMAMMDEMENMQ